MSVTTISSRDFNQDLAKAKRNSLSGPVFITDRGKPSHVLLSFDQYEKLTVQGKNIVRKCASFHVPDPRSDRDAFLAATAIVNQITVATRNTKDFLGTRVPLINTWKREQNNK